MKKCNGLGLEDPEVAKTNLVCKWIASFEIRQLEPQSFFDTCCPDVTCREVVGEVLALIGLR